VSDAHPANFVIAPVINALERDRQRPIVEMIGGAPWTGGDILEAISTLSQALRSRGAHNGVRVALLAGNSVEVLLLENAIRFAGGVLVSLHPLGSADDHLFAGFLKMDHLCSARNDDRQKRGIITLGKDLLVLAKLAFLTAFREGCGEFRADIAE